MDTSYSTQRAHLRMYLVSVVDSAEAIHRAMRRGDLDDAIRYADDLRVLGASVYRTMERIQRAVAELQDKRNDS